MSLTAPGKFNPSLLSSQVRWASTSEVFEASQLPEVVEEVAPTTKAAQWRIAEARRLGLPEPTSAAAPAATAPHLEAGAPEEDAVTGGGEDCVEQLNADRQFQWNDKNCKNTQRPFVCEIVCMGPNIHNSKCSFPACCLPVT